MDQITFDYTSGECVVTVHDGTTSRSLERIIMQARHDQANNGSCPQAREDWDKLKRVFNAPPEKYTRDPWAWVILLAGVAFIIGGAWALL